MTIDHSIEAAPGGSRGSLVRLRCTAGQARALSTTLDGMYPGRRHVPFPLIGETFTYGCSVLDSPRNLHAKWPGIEVLLLIGQAAGDAQTPVMRVRPAPAPESAAPSEATAPSTPPTLAPPRVLNCLFMPGRTEPAGTAVAPETDGIPALLSRARLAPAGERRRLIEPLFEPTDPATFEAGLLYAQTLEELGACEESLEVYRLLEHQPPGGCASLVRAGRLRVLSALGKHCEVMAQVAPDEPSPLLRGLLGLAYAALQDHDGAIAHLEHGWQSDHTRGGSIARSLARLYWQRGRYDEAAAPYRMVLERAPADLEQSECAAADFAAIVELARLGAYDDLAGDRLLDCLFAYCGRATDELRAAEAAHQLVLSGLEMGRRLQDSTRLFQAYQLVVDNHLQRREGQRLVDLMEEAAIDHHRGLLATGQRYDILDAITDNLTDYPQLLRLPLIANFEDLLRAALDEDEHGTGPMPTASRELYRSLYDLDRRSPLCERYRRVAASRQANQRDRVHAPHEHMTLAGKRIAIVGGHDSTRLRVREQLNRLGARVDDVAPATSGRVNERDILDRVRLSDLIVLVVTYMGHDMSTIVSNLSARGALAGQVLPVECRGATGVTRAVTEWAQTAQSAAAGG